MNTRLDELQRILITEIEIFKLMLISAGYTTPRPAISIQPETKSSNTYEDYEYNYDFNNNSQANVIKNLEYSKKNRNYAKSSHRLQPKTKRETYPREREVKESNETIIKTDMGKAFVFFWRISDMENILNEDIELISPLIEYLGMLTCFKTQIVTQSILY